MHTTQGRNCCFHHNGDYSGEVIIDHYGEEIYKSVDELFKDFLPKFYSESQSPVLCWNEESKDYVAIELEDLRIFFDRYLTSRLVNKIENASFEELLEISKKVFST